MNNLPTIGIIAGSGHLPAQLIESCEKNGRDFFIIAFEESFSHEIMAHLPHAVVRLGEVGKALEHLRNAGVEQVVMAGGLKRPSLSSIKPDAAGAVLLKKLGKAFFFGDDALLKAVTSFFEEEGFKVIGADEILGGLMAGEGVLGKIKPDKSANTDIAIGMVAAKNLGALDIGQAVVVDGGVVIGMETQAGTDELIERCKKSNIGKTRTGVLVKAKKPTQETRVDLPSIGVETIENIYKAGFAGVAVEAGGSLLIEKDKLIKKANEYGLFVVGVKL